MEFTNYMLRTFLGCGREPGLLLSCRGQRVVVHASGLEQKRALRDAPHELWEINHRGGKKR